MASPLAVVGVDGGQTQTRVAVAGSATVVELPGVSRLEDDPDETLVDHLDLAWQRHGLPRLARVVLGLTTLPSSAQACHQLAARIGAVTTAHEVWLTDDRVTAHRGALGDQGGVSLVVGTGVACTALGQSGRVRFFDGHGFLLGDEGAGFWVGRAGLAAVLHHRDGYGPPTELADAARAHFGDLAALPETVHSHRRAVEAVARFAVPVIAEADRGDAVASAILDEAAGLLARTTGAAVRWLADQQQANGAGGSVPMALGGRLLAARAVRRRVEAALATSAPGGRLCPSNGSPLDGALQLGESGTPGRYREFVHVWDHGGIR